MKHRSRVEREENEAADKKRIAQANGRDNLRIKELENNLKKKKKPKGSGGEDDSDDDDLEDYDGMAAEVAELKKGIAQRQVTLDNYEKNKKWNVDNLVSCP